VFSLIRKNLKKERRGRVGVGGSAAMSDSISSWVEVRDTHEDDGSEDGEAVVGSGEGMKV
jgi:hypothetical protein